MTTGRTLRRVLPAFCLFIEACAVSLATAKNKSPTGEIIMAQSVDPSEFHDRVIEGKDRHKTITLESGDGAELENVEMHPVSKNVLTQAVEAMPDSVFNDIDAEDEDISAEEAEEIAQETGGARVTEEMYEAFEKLCKESLEHEGLSNVQMELIVDEFAFDVIFELGSEILNFSIEESGNVKDFRAQN